MINIYYHKPWLIVIFRNLKLTTPNWKGNKFSFLGIMMTSSNGNIFRVTGLLCGESTGHKWRGASMFSLICTWTNGWANNRDASDSWRHRAHYDVPIMDSDKWICELGMALHKNCQENIPHPVGNELFKTILTLQIFPTSFCGPSWILYEQWSLHSLNQ